MHSFSVVLLSKVSNNHLSSGGTLVVQSWKFLQIQTNVIPTP